MSPAADCTPGQPGPAIRCSVKWTQSNLSPLDDRPHRVHIEHPWLSRGPRLQLAALRQTCRKRTSCSVHHAGCSHAGRHLKWLQRYAAECHFWGTVLCDADSHPRWDCVYKTWKVISVLYSFWNISTESEISSHEEIIRVRMWLMADEHSFVNRALDTNTLVGQWPPGRLAQQLLMQLPAKSFERYGFLLFYSSGIRTYLGISKWKVTLTQSTLKHTMAKRHMDLYAPTIHTHTHTEVVCVHRMHMIKFWQIHVGANRSLEKWEEKLKYYRRRLARFYPHYFISVSSASGFCRALYIPCSSFRAKQKQPDEKP